MLSASSKSGKIAGNSDGEGRLFRENDPEVEVRKLREYRDTRTRQDTQLLVNSWRAIARSHRLLDRPVYKAPPKGELSFFLRLPNLTR